MPGRLALAAAALMLAGCAGLEPAGRNAGRAPAPPVPMQSQPTTPAPQQAAPPTEAPAAAAEPAPAAPAPPVASSVEVAPAPQPEARGETRTAANDDDIVVPGASEGQVLPPQGDPRSREERREDVRRWDQCVMQVQNAFDADPMNPQLSSPEEYCRSTLGMADRTAVPASRLERR